MLAILCLFAADNLYCFRETAILNQGLSVWTRLVDCVKEGKLGEKYKDGQALYPRLTVEDSIGNIADSTHLVWLVSAFGAY